LQEPRRLFRRYATDFWNFAGALAAQWWRMEARGSIRRFLELAQHFASSRIANLINTPLKRGVNENSRQETAQVREPPGLRCLMSEPSWQRIHAPDWLDAQAVHRDAAKWEKIATGARHCLLETAEVRFIDSTGVSLLVRLHGRLRAAGKYLLLLDPGPPVKRVLKVMRLEDFFLTASDALEARELITARNQAEQSPVLTDGPLSPVVWQGEITTANAAKVWELTRREIKSRSSWRKEWVIDLSGVTFMDSEGAALMGRLQQYAPRRGAHVHFTGASDKVCDVLRRAGIEDSLLGNGAQSAPSPAASEVSRQKLRRLGNPLRHVHITPIRPIRPIRPISKLEWLGNLAQKPSGSERHSLGGAA
jgi:anti-anti-sigma factor